MTKMGAVVPDVQTHALADVPTPALADVPTPAKAPAA